MCHEHKAKQGECIDSIAMKYGFFPMTLWSHPSNEGLRASRKNRNVLFPGDEVFIPDLQRKNENAETEQRHRFRRLGVPGKIRLKFLKPKEEEPPEEEDVGGDDSNYTEPAEQPVSREMEPIANAPYVMIIDGRTFEGQTDGDGMLEEAIPPDSREGKITLYPGTSDEKTMPLELGGIDPVDTVIGARKRLSNLGYPCTLDDELSAELREKLIQFQTDYGIAMSGELDDATKQKLVEVHGS